MPANRRPDRCAFSASCRLFLLLFATPAPFADGPHRVALQITDNDADKMNAVLNVAANVSKYYSDKGEEVEIQVVAFNAGLHMLREDTSPVKPRIASFAEEHAERQLQGVPEHHRRDDQARRQRHSDCRGGGCACRQARCALIELSEKGWTILRP